MTPDILTSDIELAKRLLRQQQPDEQVVAALVRRKIPAARAAQLVADLRQGKPVMATAAVTFGSRPAAAAPVEMPAPETFEPATLDEVPPSAPVGRSPNRRLSRWLGLACLGVMPAGLGLMLGWRFLTQSPSHVPTSLRPASAETRAQLVPPASAQGPARQRVTAALAAPELALRPDGLYLGTSRLQRPGVLATLIQVLGAPTRTNRVEAPSRTIYAFDADGLLVYSQPGAGEECLVLDYDGLGGTHGALTAFAGKLQVGEELIPAAIPAQTLAAKPNLGLTNSAPEAGVLAGHYQGLGLNFLYLQSLQRLSLVEIDLK